MRALLLSPDYASHYFPLSALGRELRSRGYDVLVATGPALRSRVEQDGFGYRELVLGPGSNPGLIRAAEQPGDEGERVDAFLAATREGMIETLRYQAESRLRDLLWRPEEVTARLSALLAEVRPSVVVSDQLAFGATLALRALAQPYVSFHPGHPSAIVGPGEVFGFPALRSREFDADDRELANLWERCVEVSERFTHVFNRTLRGLNPSAPQVVSAFAATSPLLTLVNYPAELGEYRRASLPRSVHFVGASVRHEPITDPTLSAWLARPNGELPRIYVSFGSFLSARSDVLARIVDAFRAEPIQLVVASGVTQSESLPDVPKSWRIQPYVPQPALLRWCDLAISHGGNNTVTEALWAGVPLLLCPFSTDQFAAAEDVRRSGLGDVFDPNAASPEAIADLARGVLAGAAPERAALLSERLRSGAGPAYAVDLIVGLAARRRSVARAGASRAVRPSLA